MRLVKPFSQDPSATASFTALRDIPVPRTSKPSQGSEILRAVVIGGGTGAPMSIRTLLSLGLDVSAVVAMADDGGSTGILREEADVTPPGDVRKCILAMAADPQDPLTRALKYRFAIADNHSLGNLLIVALEDVAGSFPEAIAICEKLVDAQGHVYPSTLSHVSLAARTRAGGLLDGQAAACHSPVALDRVKLYSPEPIQAYQPALDAVAQADLVILGPGSLFTSIIPNLLVPGMLAALKASKAVKIFVCALADVQGETRGLSAREHVEALLDHGMRGMLDYALVHSSTPLVPGGGSTPTDGEGQSKVKPVRICYEDAMAIQAQGPIVIASDLVDRDNPLLHDPAALRDALWGVVRRCRSPRK